jgi:hypothetical protein
MRTAAAHSLLQTRHYRILRVGLGSLQLECCGANGWHSRKFRVTLAVAERKNKGERKVNASSTVVCRRCLLTADKFPGLMK